MKAPKPGQKVKGFFPWLSGIREGVVKEKRIPLEGEYFFSTLASGTIVQRSGNVYGADARREYWIIDLIQV